MLTFSTHFPYLDLTDKGSAAIKKVDIALPKSESLLGYFVKFRLKLIETFSNFTSMSEHKILVYYSNAAEYASKCFPLHLFINRPW